MGHEQADRQNERRDRFDRLLEDVIESLPGSIRGLLERVAVVVIDRPGPELVASLKREGTLEAEADGSDLCGLHSGTAFTEQSVEGLTGSMPSQIHLFRDGITDLAGGWEQVHADEEVYEEIRITLLHEIGHQFGLDEGNLDELGFA